MAGNLILEQSEVTPKVVFETESGKLEITGRSLPEDAVEFYDPLKNWIDEYTNSPNTHTELSIDLDYFNSASAKQLVDLLVKLEEVNVRAEHAVIVKWGYEKDDDLMIIRGEEMASIINLPFQFCEY